MKIDDSNRILFRLLEDLKLTVRTENCLRAHGIMIIGHLIFQEQRWLSKIQNFGKKSLMEVKEALAKNFLTFDYESNFPESIINAVFELNSILQNETHLLSEREEFIEKWIEDWNLRQCPEEEKSDEPFKIFQNILDEIKKISSYLRIAGE